MRTRRRARLAFWAIVLVGLAVGLCLQPLFNLLGYEFCFVLGLVAAVAGVQLGAAEVADRRAEAVATDGERPLRAIALLFGRALGQLWALLLLPLLAISLNALRVRNCSFTDGLGWFAVLPLASAACGVVTGVAAGLAIERRWLALLTGAGVILASVLWSVARFYGTPAIFSYDPFGGYFPGTLYDEEVAIGAPLLFARAHHFAWALSALGLCALFLDERSLALDWRKALSRRRLALACLAPLALAVGLGAAHARLGFYLDAGDVQRALGASAETEHFVLHYTPAGPFARDLPLVKADHELRFAQLARLFGRAPDGKIHAYLFDSAAQKHALMGAGHTFIAKPWRREIYLQADGWPHPVLMHELAHVFAGTFGDRIFGISRRGVAINVGMIEGVAVAAAWAGTPLTPHQSVKVMRDNGFQPSLGRVMSLDFLGLNASQAYNLAGSFCRFLLDRYGAQPLLSVFHDGGAETAYARAFGKPFSALAAEWSAFIDTVPVPASEAELTRDRLRRPSVFHKVCAHELALKREEARRAQAASQRERALAGWEAVCSADPDEPQNVADLMDAVFAGDDLDGAERAARRLLAHPKVSTALAGRAHALLGDVAFRRGERERARSEYALARALPLDEANARLITVKRLATLEPPGPIAELLTRFLATPQSNRDAAIDLLTTSELTHLAPERPLFHYLFARQLESRGQWPEAARELERSLADSGAGLPDARFRREALRLLGRTLFRKGDRDGARRAFARLAEDPDEGVRLEARDWLERCAFRLPGEPA